MVFREDKGFKLSEESESDASLPKAKDPLSKTMQVESGTPKLSKPLQIAKESPKKPFMLQVKQAEAPLGTEDDDPQAAAERRFRASSMMSQSLRD